MSKVVIITTGGTIAMQHDSVTGAAVPAVSGADLVRAIPGLGSVCDLEVREFDNLPSPAITPDHMFRLAAMVRQYLAMDDVSGVVITHGTDSLEESAYFLDLSLEGHKPVCFTAAMRSGDELSPDGPRNILAAVRVAASRSARNMGSLVVMNEQIHAAREVTKTHAANVATFQSPWWGPLGVVDGDRVIFRRAQLGRQTFLPHSLCKKVDLIKLVTGSDAAYLDFAVSRGVDGIVVESFGRGNVPPYVIPGIARALEKGIIVVNATRTGGRVLDEYGYEGGMLQQHKMGVIMAGELSAAKARLKLMLILSQYGPDGRPDPAEVARYFEHSMWSCGGWPRPQSMPKGRSLSGLFLSVPGLSRPHALARNPLAFDRGGRDTGKRSGSGTRPVPGSLQRSAFL